MKKILLLEKRKKAKELYKGGWSIRKISKYLVSGKNNVNRWVKTDEKELLRDNRGWKKDRPRKYTKEQKEEIKNIRNKLEKEEGFFIGGKVVKANYNNSYDDKVSKDFVDRTLREYKMVKSPQKKRKGLSKYMQYPQYTLNKLGKIVMSIDFIGPKYLKGSSDKINFLSCKYIRPKKEGIVKRVEGQTTDEVIKILKEVWQTNPIPNVLKVDNDSAFGTNSVHERCVGRLTLLLLILNNCKN
jgi:transposase